jgi:hypothetical protein
MPKGFVSGVICENTTRNISWNSVLIEKLTDLVLTIKSRINFIAKHTVKIKG